MKIIDTVTDGMVRYAERTGRLLCEVHAALFDMDGVLYDSMPRHARAWMAMCRRAGLKATHEEFFGFEGRTGASTINILFQRQYGHGADDETCRRLYAIKSAIFQAMGPAPIMPGAHAALAEVEAAGAKAVLVTGSGQASILERLHHDYPYFSARVTAHDVKRGKPDPEPYTKGMQLAGVEPWQAIAVDNAPLGVESASASGAFTIGVNTGKLPKGTLSAAGADIEINSMDECAKLLHHLLYM